MLTAFCYRTFDQYHCTHSACFNVGSSSLDAASLPSAHHLLNPGTCCRCQFLLGLPNLTQIYYRQPLHFSADAADHSLQSIPHSTARDGTFYAHVSASMDLASAPPAEALSSRPQVKTGYGSRHNSPSVTTSCSTGRDPEPADVQRIIGYQLSVMLRLRATM